MHGFLSSFFFFPITQQIKQQKKISVIFITRLLFLVPFLCYTERNKTREAQMATIFDYLKEVTYDSFMTVN